METHTLTYSGNTKGYASWRTEDAEEDNIKATFLPSTVARSQQVTEFNDGQIILGLFTTLSQVYIFGNRNSITASRTNTHTFTSFYQHFWLT